MREAVIEKVIDRKIIAIIRGLKGDKCLKVADALYKGGITMIEITFNQSAPDNRHLTTDSIAAIRKHFGNDVLVGAGTVMTPEQVCMAGDAGALYIISPDVNPEVIKKTRELGLVSIPGALTPSEITSAHRYGADIVKLFPAANMGVSYIKAIRAPINHIPMMAVGGINENNIRDFVNAGCIGAGVGGNLVNKTWIEAGEYYKITELAKKMVAALE